MSTIATAGQLGLIRCQACGLTCRVPGSGSDDGEPSTHALLCPRCGSALHRRLPGSLARSWALLIAAAILYIPANLLPIMHTQTLFESGDNTILSGIVTLWRGGMWDLALIVFVASILVPLAKIASLALLLFAAHRPAVRGRPQLTRLYRIIDYIGHWSMLDIFVVALLTALVRFGQFGDVRPEPGAVAFGAVVILTMLASMSFDPRLLWDGCEGEQDEHG